jgi:hypothetical protein
MDFEWANQTGPVEASSPFVNPQHQQAAKKRTHSVLDSPSKNAFATPNRLREPDNRPFFFSQESSSKPLPLPPHVQHPSNWEPRTPASTYDYSSGGDTPNTPNVDSDAATPDTQLASKMGRLASDTNSPKKPGRRESWFKRTFGGSPSPLKDRERDESRKYYSQKAENRIQKRRSERSRSKKRTLRDIDDDEDESDKERSNMLAASQEQGAVKQTFGSSLANFMHWLEAHPQLPSVLSYYMQLGVNIFLASAFVYIIWGAWAAVLSDVEIEAQKHMSVVLVEIASCAKQYTANRCRPEEVVPAMEKTCGTWETCMKRDPEKVARASVTAKTFAKIFNSFVEEFSYKSMVCLGIFVYFFVLVWVLVCRWNRQCGHACQHQHQHNAQAIPSTHQHSLPHPIQHQQYIPIQTPYEIEESDYSLI